ncbi:MAG TPA: arsenic resistance N-acetyltransferase ArsN2 [Anaeromyxobacteraceae bacterium]|nr:arsenic resistance N-acetyltransferase ArsN2 [Anaeromyxobacteraceae bacterium]
MRIETGTTAHLAFIRSLLDSLKLPSQDVGAPNQSFLIARDAHDLVGCVGLEEYGSVALLRSLAVALPWQGRGVGRALHDAALGVARGRGIREVFLLTTSAKAFFAHAGYGMAGRDTVPAPIQSSPEFRALCPASAVCMSRRLL